MTNKIKCEFCNKGPTDGVTVYRTNEKGVEGKWACGIHLPVNKQPDPKITEIVQILEDL